MERLLNKHQLQLEDLYEDVRCRGYQGTNLEDVSKIMGINFRVVVGLKLANVIDQDLC